MISKHSCFLLFIYVCFALGVLYSSSSVRANPLPTRSIVLIIDDSGSMGDPPSTGKYGKVLFDIRSTTSIASELDGQNLAEELKRAFEESGIILTQDITILPEEDGWSIANNQQKYMVKREQGKLSISGGARKIQFVKSAIIDFVDEISPDTEVAIVTLPYYCKQGSAKECIVQGFTTNKVQMKTLIGQLDAGDKEKWTYLSCSIQTALELLKDRASELFPDRKSAEWEGCIVVLGDGQDHCKDEHSVDTATIMRQLSPLKAKIETISIDTKAGSEAEEDYRNFAYPSRAEYERVKEPAKLDDVLRILVKGKRMEQATTLLSTVLVIAFAIERFIGIVMFIGGFSRGWRQLFDMATASDSDTKARIQRNRRTVSFIIAAIIGIIGVGWLGNVRILAQLGYRMVPAAVDAIFTGLLVAGGTEPIRDLFQRQEERRLKPKEENEPQLVQLSGTVQLQNIPGDADRKL